MLEKEKEDGDIVVRGGWRDATLVERKGRLA